MKSISEESQYHNLPIHQRDIIELATLSDLRHVRPCVTSDGDRSVSGESDGQVSFDWM